MSFISNFSDQRVFDPQEGWELFLDKTFMGYSHRFRLVHERQEVRFGADIVETKDVDGETELGRRLALKRWRVYNLRSSIDMPEAKRLIEGALEAFGVAFNGPSGPVEVEYPENASEAAQ